MVKNQTHYIPAWHDPSQKVPQYKTIYKVTTASLKSKNEQAVQYAKTIKNHSELRRATSE